MKPLSFRLAVPDDHLTLAHLRWRMRTEERDPAPVVSRAVFVAHYIAHLCATNQADWIALLEEEVIGTMSIVSVPIPPRPCRIHDALGYLTNCYVVPNRRNEGIGSRLLEHAVAWARSAGFELLIVWPSDRAVQFYERCGFSRDNDTQTLQLRALLD